MLLWLRNLDFAGGDMEVTPSPTHPQGAGISQGMKRRILAEDEIIMAVIMAFLQMRDR